ncbi:MAG: DUF1905 domain-containing protein [Patescibacteria group bacterium UBA2163]
MKKISQKNKYHVTAQVWIYPGKQAQWYFITIPKKESSEIKKSYGHVARGWRSLPVCVTIGQTEWRTSVFPDSHSGSYLLPLKAAVRRAEAIESGDSVRCSLSILLDV